MKTRTALAGASISALIAAGGVGYGFSDPGSPLLGPLSSILGATLLGHVPNNAALGNLPARLARVRRDGFAASGDGGAADYTLSATPCSNANGGAQVALNGGGCATLDAERGGVTPQVFGAKGDSNGTAGNGTDDTTAFQNWLGYSFATDNLTGRSIYLPALPQGRVYRLTAPLVSYASSFVRGDGCTPGADVTSFKPGGGSILFFDHPGVGYHAVGGEEVLQDVCTFRAQPTPSNANDNTFTPGNFDFDIQADTDIELRNVTLIDPTKGALGYRGRFWINGLKGRPLTIGVATDALLDTPKWRGIHFWPYSAGNATSVYNWQYNNLVAFDLKRMDNAEIENVSSIVQKTCFSFKANTNTDGTGGSANKLRAANIDCDGIGGGAGIYVDPSVTASAPVTAMFTNFTTQTSNAPGNSPYTGGGLDIEGSGSTIHLNNFQATFPACAAMYVNGTGNILKVQGAFIQDWGMRNPACQAVQVATGNDVRWTDWPTFDYALSPAAALNLYGGSRYSLAPQAMDGFPAGVGKLSLLDITNGSSAEILMAGGMSNILQAGTSLVNAGGSTDAGCKANTPSGKVGICYSTDRAMYVIYNNTSAQLNYVFNESTPRPIN